MKSPSRDRAPLMLSTVAATLVLFVDARLGYRLADQVARSRQSAVRRYEPNGANNGIRNCVRTINLNTRVKQRAMKVLNNFRNSFL